MSRGLFLAYPLLDGREIGPLYPLLTFSLFHKKSVTHHGRTVPDGIPDVCVCMCFTSAAGMFICPYPQSVIAAPAVKQTKLLIYQSGSRNKSKCTLSRVFCSTKRRSSHFHVVIDNFGRIPLLPTGVIFSAELSQARIPYLLDFRMRLSR